jgi:hypothetical protein
VSRKITLPVSCERAAAYDLNNNTVEAVSAMGLDAVGAYIIFK